MSRAHPHHLCPDCFPHALCVCVLVWAGPQIAERLAAQQKATGIKLLWGTANLFSHPRYMAGAGTNPDFHVFAYAAAQVKKAMEITHQLGGKEEGARCSAGGPLVLLVLCCLCSLCCCSLLHFPKINDRPSCIDAVAVG